MTCFDTPGSYITRGMVKHQSPAASFGKIAGQNGGAHGILRACTETGKDTGPQKLAVITEKGMNKDRHAENSVTDPENHGSLHECRQEAVDHLKALSRKVVRRGEDTELKITKAKLLHHGRKKVFLMLGTPRMRKTCLHPIMRSSEAAMAGARKEPTVWGEGRLWFKARCSCRQSLPFGLLTNRRSVPCFSLTSYSTGPLSRHGAP